MSSLLKIYNPSSVPEFDIAMLRAQRKRHGLQMDECSWVLFADKVTWKSIENGDYDRIQTLAVVVFADLLDCKFDDLLTHECYIEELPDVLEVIDSGKPASHQPNLMVAHPNVARKLGCGAPPHVDFYEDSEYSEGHDQTCHSTSQC